jgi:hypothetical protein
VCCVLLHKLIHCQLHSHTYVKGGSVLKLLIELKVG